MEIIYSNDAKKYLARQGKKTAIRIRDAIERYSEHPETFTDVQPLEGYTDGRFRIKVGGYRVVLRYDEDGTLRILFVVEIDTRGQIYKHMKRRK